MPHNPLAMQSARIVLVGLMGAGKSALGKRLAAKLGLPFHDSDAAIEAAADSTVAEIFARHGEAHFRAGERRVIARLLADGPIILATGGGAFMDLETRALIRSRALSVWLRCPIPILLSRVAGRAHRPLLNAGDPETILTRLSSLRAPVYAEADIIFDCTKDPPDMTTERLLTTIEAHRPPRRIPVQLARSDYEVLIGPGLIRRAGAHLAPILPQKRAVIVTDAHVAQHHLGPLQSGLEETGIAHETVIVEPGETAKSLAGFGALIENLMALRPERRTAIIALGGGVVGDLAGFAAATALRGLPFVQIPTTLLAQVDSSVGGKTGINSRFGKNLIGAFHQPLAVLADTDALATLPLRERAAGYAEIAKAGLIADPALYEWCEENSLAMLAGNQQLQAEAIARAVAFKARIVAGDEREEKPEDGRALLNLGHSFGHALEAETGYGGGLLHGEAVATGIVCAFDLSARLGFCDPGLAPRIAAHLAAAGLPVSIAALPAGALLGHMRGDKKMRDGKLSFVLARGIGEAFTCRDVPEEVVRETLLANGATAEG